MSEQVKIEVGQHWKSTDPRLVGEKERVLEIIVVEETCITVKNVKTGKESRILPARMKPGSRGYTLVKDVDHAPTPTETEAA